MLIGLRGAVDVLAFHSSPGKTHTHTFLTGSANVCRGVFFHFKEIIGKPERVHAIYVV